MFGDQIRNIILYSFAVFCLAGCTHSKTIFRGSLTDSEHLKISFSKYRGVDHISMVLKENGELKSSFFLTDFPASKGFVIEGIIRNTSGVSSNYYLVTDTVNNKFASFGHNFLDQHNTPATMATFIPVQPWEIDVFRKLAQVLEKYNLSLRLSAEDINRIIGWVKLN